MQTIRIIMTNCKSAFGSWYVLFREKEFGFKVGEVDRVDGRYVIFAGREGFLDEIGTRTKKDSAIKFLQDHIRSTFTAPVEFKWNVMQVRERYV